MPEQDVSTLAAVLENALAPLDSLAAILRGGDFHDVAQVSFALVEESRGKLLAVAKCLEKSCDRKLTILNFNGILALEPCRDCPKKKKGCAFNAVEPLPA